MVKYIKEKLFKIKSSLFQIPGLLKNSIIQKGSQIKMKWLKIKSIKISDTLSSFKNFTQEFASETLLLLRTKWSEIKSIRISQIPGFIKNSIQAYISREIAEKKAKWAEIKAMRLYEIRMKLTRTFVPWIGAGILLELTKDARLKNNSAGWFDLHLYTECDAPEPWQMYLQDPATPTYEGMISFHNYLTFFIILIGCVVFWLVYKIIETYHEELNPTPLVFTHSSVLEITWTIIPAIVLLIIAVPSFSLLYSLDEVVRPTITVKVIGHQWYWSYEYSDRYSRKQTRTIGYDSYMDPQKDLWKGRPRLLEVDRKLVLPTKTHIRILVTSADVLHSWSIPSFGIKIDACPGRLSQSSIYLKREGQYFGQCSEICGVNHGFMPIGVRVVKRSNFNIWMRKIATHKDYVK